MERLLLYKLAICAYFILTSFTRAVSAETLYLVNDDFPPYNSASLLKGGLATDIVTTALKRAGYETRIEFLPWSRALKYAKTGRADGVLGAWYTEERAKNYLYSTPLLNSKLRLVKLTTKEITIENLEVLSVYSIGLLRNYAYELPVAYEDTNTTVINDFYQGLELLRRGRIDLLPEEENVARHQLQKIYPKWDEIYNFAGPVLGHKALHFVISKKRKDADTIIRRFNEALAQIKSDGTLAQIYRDHNIPPPDDL
ncbi:substrate-binding periplasmic protein [Kiloniella majae]|uniref:substrate-binding periplasmic protein n=1 Tax=Kiloniella majae TaxID=1938558 RepID=UPI000A2778F8|nr:transporter substrate-binding domain-containing protein [Kiloniella majae]